MLESSLKWTKTEIFFDPDVQINIKYDPLTQLCAIIVLHTQKEGSTLGGCRWLAYSNLNEAIGDATRLAKGMSYKSAISGLSYGGGKAVVVRPAYIRDKEQYFKSFAKFVDQLEGKYITTADSGLSTCELDLIAKYTNFVTGQTFIDGSSGDPSPFTAKGVLLGIEAAVKYKLNKNSLEGLHIVIQGVGNVGQYLMQEFIEKGARLTVCDTNPVALRQCQEKFGVGIVEPQNIYDVKCDIFSPCALGGILNEDSIARLNTSIIAGCANNQLKSTDDGQRLVEKNILYTPDYVINAGGLIKVAAQYEGASLQHVNEKIEEIPSRLLRIFEIADSSNKPTNLVSDEMALRILSST